MSRRAAAEIGRYASLCRQEVSTMRRVFSWIALPLVLMPCAAMESADPPKTNCPNRMCIVLATLNEFRIYVDDDGTALDEALVIGGYGWEIDNVTATTTTSIYGSRRKGSFLVQVARGSVRIEQPPDMYLIVLEPGPRHEHFRDMERFLAIEAYPIKEGKVCTFRALREYAPLDGARYSLLPVNPPSSQRKNCYSVEDLKRNAW
jgi:hypothetical protein